MPKFLIISASKYAWNMLTWEQSKEQISWFDFRLGEGVGREYHNEDILKFVPSRLLQSLT